MVFPASVIRKLAPSEEWFAQTQTFGSVTLHLSGRLDTDAMSVAFDALLESHPVLAGHLEEGPDGRHQIVVTDDLLHPGMRMLEGDNRPSSETSRMELDQRVSLVDLMVKPADERAELTFYVHHGLADGHHAAGLLFELFSRYTDVVCTGTTGPVGAQPTPESLEVVLERRGVGKQRRSGLERFMPAMFAYELPPPRSAGRSNPTQPVVAPTGRGRLTKDETAAMVEFGLANRLFVNSLVSAAILLAEWRLRETPDIPIPYLYAVDLRSLLEPPVPAMDATNLVGMATYLAAIRPNTNLIDLGRDIAETLQADLTAGVIQQSMLHMKVQYDEGQRGLPDVVSSTNLGRVPALRVPPNLQVDDWQTDLYRASLAVDMYTVGIFAEQLFIEHHVHAPEPERSVDLVLSILRAAVLENQR